MKITNSSDSEEDVNNYNELINQIITETNNYTVKKKNEDAVITYSIWQARKNFKHRNYYKYGDDAMMPNIQEYKKIIFRFIQIRLQEIYRNFLNVKCEISAS